MPITGTLVRIECYDRMKNTNVIREVLVTNNTDHPRVLSMTEPGLDWGDKIAVALHDAVVFLAEQPDDLRGDVTIPGVGRVFLAEW